MWEWTTEESTNGRVAEDNNPYAVFRSGSFDWTGSYCPLASRDACHSGVTGFYVMTGFRVVLYIK